MSTSSIQCQSNNSGNCNCSSELKRLLDNKEDSSILVAILFISITLLIKEVLIFLTKLYGTTRKYCTFRASISNKDGDIHSSEQLRERFYLPDPSQAEIQINAAENRLSFQFHVESNRKRSQYFPEDFMNINVDDNADYELQNPDIVHESMDSMDQAEELDDSCIYSLAKPNIRKSSGYD
ncbi:uncharacterized protein LOC134268910 [Saccostrea cucullata]|uniref:uncharacterized protein LOC134268910 n=1 Tax=Saccostrea cuccullata TaxID=36930 RepID=UPI002ED01254